VTAWENDRGDAYTQSEIAQDVELRPQVNHARVAATTVRFNPDQ